MPESWRSTILGIIPAVAGLVLVIVGALKEKADVSMIVMGLGLLGAGGIGAVSRDQAQHNIDQQESSSSLTKQP